MFLMSVLNELTLINDVFGKYRSFQFIVPFTTPHVFIFFSIKNGGAGNWC